VRPGIRIALITVISLLTVVLAVVFATRFGQDPRLSPSPLIGAQAPNPTLDVVESDAVLNLDDLRGEIVVVNFWAPWCVPCRAEHPDLLRIVDDYEAFGVTVVGITYQSTEPAVTAYLDELGRGYPVVMDDRSRAAIEFGVRGVPETYFIDRDGVVVAKVAGPVDYAIMSATIDQIVVGETVGS
jgi:cytochrome c biogenesis protein CcmG/thiol:disulfide interchange protein DsbE